MRRQPLIMFAFLLGAALAVPAQAQWKWVDKDKRVQYSDLPPPPGVAEQDILQRPRGAERPAAAAPAPASAPASSAPLLAPKMTDPELEAKRKKTEQEEAAKKKAEQERIAAVKADNCTRAQAQMRALESGVRIAKTNAKGEREVLDDAGRADEVKRTKAMVSSECK